MIYFDNAATTFPKPPEVSRAVLKCLSSCGNPGRGAHALSLAAAELLYECRCEAAALFGVSEPERILFTLNTTHALNQAIWGTFRPGDHVLCSELEHNAVRRPLEALAHTGDFSFDTFPVLGLSVAGILDGIEKRLTEKSAGIVCIQSSNICSVTLPVQEIGALCRARGLRFIVDAAQSAGHLPIRMESDGIDLLCAPGHKGLYGPQGCGILALGPGVTLRPLLSGGSGVDSRSPFMPDLPPERYEAGTLPTPAIAGLLAGLHFLRETGLSEIREREEKLFSQALFRLSEIPGIKIYCPEHPGPVLLFNREGIESTDLSTYLDSCGICTRAGLHCAPLAHEALKTPPGGAVRLSFGAFNTIAELDALYAALK